MEYFAGLDVSMKETHVCVPARVRFVRRLCENYLPTSKTEEIAEISGSLINLSQTARANRQ